MILIDGGYLTARSRYAFRNLTNSAGVPTGAVFGFLSTIQRIRKNYPDQDIYVCMDSYSKWRADLMSCYKSNRDSHKEGWFETEKAKQHALDREAILAIAPVIKNVTVLYADGAEADDLIAQLASEQDKAIILSSDKDLWQLAQYGAVLTSKIDKGKFVISSYPTEFGEVPVKALALYRAIMGDSSDQIPKVKGVSTKDVQALCKQVSDLEELLYAEGDIRETNKTTKAIYANIEQVKLNYEVCKLPSSHTFVQKQITSDKARANDFINKLEILSIRSVID